MRATSRGDDNNRGGGQPIINALDGLEARGLYAFMREELFATT